jgi:hypothetical protein
VASGRKRAMSRVRVRWSCYHHQCSLADLNVPGSNGRDFKILRGRVHNLNIEMSADRYKSVRQY